MLTGASPSANPSAFSSSHTSSGSSDSPTSPRAAHRHRPRAAHGSASAYIAYRNFDALRDFITREWRTLVIAEAIFLVFFNGWTLFRSYDPFINHTEQPMDLALLSASINSQVGHPEDPWLRGEPISYYYFGYWMMSALSQISAIQSHISYNLALRSSPRWQR